MKHRLFIAFLVATGLVGAKNFPSLTGLRKTATSENLSQKSLNRKVGLRNRLLRETFKKRLSGVAVSGKGVVVKVLTDDNKGTRHQRFILRVSSSQTILIAHNIDLAKRAPNLRVGDTVTFRGQYEWNAKGGMVHWTHHDPHGRRSGGWIKLRERKYQ